MGPMDGAEVDVFQVAQRHSRGLLILFAAAAISLTACGGGSSTPSPTGDGTATGGPGATDQAVPTGTDLGGAGSALAAVDNYKFTMTETGGSLGDTLSMLPIPSTGIPSFTLSGTVVLKPAKAADITVAGTLHVISVGGSDYQDIGLSGSFTKNDSTTPSLIDSLTPSSVYSSSFGPSFDFAAGFDKVGEEPKGGVDTLHYQANDAGKAKLAELGSVVGLGDATWTSEIWIAKDGGYPVSMTVTATAAATATSDAGA